MDKSGLVSFLKSGHLKALKILVFNQNITEIALHDTGKMAFVF